MTEPASLSPPSRKERQRRIAGLTEANRTLKAALAEAEELNRRLRRFVIGLDPEVLRDLDHETRELLGWGLGDLSGAQTRAGGAVDRPPRWAYAPTGFWG